MRTSNDMRLSEETSNKIFNDRRASSSPLYRAITTRKDATMETMSRATKILLNSLSTESISLSPALMRRVSFILIIIKDESKIPVKVRAIDKIILEVTSMVFPKKKKEVK